MFRPPDEIPTEVFAELPVCLREQERQRTWGGVPRDSFLEGPAFGPDDTFYCVNVPYGQILRAGREGQFAIHAAYDGEPNGLAVAGDGSLFVCDYRHGIIRIAGGAATPVVSRFRTEHFKGVNDLVFAKTGDLYFTDQGESGLNDPSGRVYRLTAGGALELVLSGIPSPNGLALTDGGSTLLVAVTRANAIWRVPLLAGGETGRVGLFIQLSGGIGPDGMAVDSLGRIAVAHLGLGTVWVFDRAGEPLYRVRSVRGKATTNVAFDPENDSVLYITEAESGAVLRARLPI